MTTRLRESLKTIQDGLDDELSANYIKLAIREINILEADRRSLCDSVVSLRRENSDLKSERDELKSKLAELERQNIGLDSELKDWKLNYKNSQDHLEFIAGQLSHCKQVFAEAKAKLAELEAQEPVAYKHVLVRESDKEEWNCIYSKTATDLSGVRGVDYSPECIVEVRPLYAHPVPVTPNKAEVPKKYFVFDPEGNMEEIYNSREEAEEAKEKLLDEYKEYAADYGFHEATNRIFWGEVIQEVEVYNTGEKIMFEGELTDCFRSRWVDSLPPLKDDDKCK